MWDQDWSLEVKQHRLDNLVKTIYQEPIEAAYYWKKRRNKANYLTWNSIRPTFLKMTSMRNSAKSLTSSATAQVAPDLLKDLAILSDTTARRTVLDQEDLKPYWKSEKRPHFSRCSTVLLHTSFLKTLLTTKRRLIGW